MTDAPSENAPVPTTAPVPTWEQRFRAARVSVPDWALDAPERCTYISNATGVFEVYAWDRANGTHRRLTGRREGTVHATIDLAGEQVWWFDDRDGDEYGVWRLASFASAGDEHPEAVPGLPRAYSAGLALGRDGVVAVGCSDEGGTTLYLRRGAGEDPVVVYAHEEDASVGDLSEDGTLLAIEHSEHGDSRHPAVRVLRVADVAVVAELWDGPGRGLEVLGFAPVAGDPRLLLQHEREGRPALLLWDPVEGTQRPLELDLPGEVSAEWFPDGDSLLVAHEAEARSELHRYDLATGALEPLGTPRGVVSSATPRPDGDVWFSWSSAAEPTVVRSLREGVVLRAPGKPPAPSVPVRDVWADGPGGRVHALLSLPEGDGPHPAVFLVHGGPTWHDSDSFASDVAAYVDHGVAVVRVNYRGSTGYGSAWRDAIEHRVGLTELEDLAAVHEELVAAGTIDGTRVALAGGSWGGYLTLLGLGVQPERWAAGVAAVPVADYVAAYEDEMEGLKAFDRSLFGGSPGEVPERYAASSPLTYVDAVKAPVLVLAGQNDPRCPIRQIENYLVALTERGVPHEVYRFDAGHGSLVVDERVRQMRVELAFVLRHLDVPA